MWWNRKWHDWASEAADETPMLYGLDERTAAIYAPVLDGLEQVDAKLKGLASQAGAAPDDLRPLLDYVAETGGKRIRPAITLLASHAYPHDPDKLVLMASAVELLHLATLIHDDTVDDSSTRRGRATVSNVWGHHVSVLFGDYVFATSATFVCDTENMRIMRRFSETIMELASGELIEYFGAYDANQARELYDDRIYRKTASLFCTAGESGAVLAGAPEEEVQAMRRYAYNIGMAFQVGDDLLDFQGDESSMGKPVGSDLLNGVLTLPTILLMERFPSENAVSDFFQDRENLGKMHRVLDLIRSSSIMDDCQEVVRDYCDQARTELRNLPHGAARHSLDALADYVCDRQR